MHYKDGTEAKLFDMIRVRTGSPQVEVTGILVHIEPRATSCNGIVQYTKAMPSLRFSADAPPVIDHFYTFQQGDFITLGNAELVLREEKDEKGLTQYTTPDGQR